MNKPHSEKTKKRISEKLKRLGIIPPSQKGKHWRLSERTKKKMRKSHSKRHNENVSKALKGKKNPKGSIAKIGNKNPNWKGGRAKIQNINEKERIAGRKKPEQCELCGAFGRICFDHDHKTGKFRGWICHRCNVVLGLVKDNTELLNQMLNYIETNIWRK